MLASVFTELGPWSWMVLGFALLAFEIVLPGVFLLWIGIAALLTGALTVQLWHWDAWTWHWQTLVFLALSLGTVLVGRRIVGNGETETDQPLLNRRAEQLVGRTAVLADPIREGYGRVRLGDTLWRVSGPDLPAGARVRVASVRDAELVVTEAP